jgi:hypothetical protein
VEGELRKEKTNKHDQRMDRNRVEKKKKEEITNLLP